jgi:hypothetical protein
MGLLQKILGSGSGNIAEVSAQNELLVKPTTTLANMGYVGMASRSDPGAAGSARVRAVWSTSANQLLTAETMYLWDDTFNATAQNTSKYQIVAHTVAMTMAQSGGFLILNNSGLTSANAGVAYQTWRRFPLFGNSEVRVIISGYFASASGPVAHSVVEFGLMSVTLGGTPAAPLDGAFFRYDASGALFGVVNYNGTETLTSVITSPALNANHDYMIIINTDNVEFWIDREFRAAIQIISAAPTQGQPFMAAEQPLTIRQYNDASGTATAVKLQVSDVFIKSVGPAMNKQWPDVKAGLGHMGYQGQNGGTMGTLANLGNGALPSASALSNTTVGTGNPVGLGGVAHVLPTLAAGTDGIVTSYQNPAGGVNQTPRNLIITGVTIGAGVDAALTGGPLAMAFSMAFGHTNVSLATSESGSFTSPTTKAPRRIWLGMSGIPVTAAAGTVAQPINVQFRSPIVVAPGEFIAIVMRNLGVVTTAGSIAITVAFDAHFE